MNIIKDLRDVDIRYVDKENLQSVTTENVVKLINTDKEEVLKIICSLIGNSKDLLKEEINALYIICAVNIPSPTPPELYKKYTKLFDKSYLTFYRAINKLIAKGICYSDSLNQIKLKSDYDFKNITNKELIIIEMMDNKKTLIF